MTETDNLSGGLVAAPPATTQGGILDGWTPPTWSPEGSLSTIMDPKDIADIDWSGGQRNLDSGGQEDRNATATTVPEGSVLPEISPGSTTGLIAYREPTFGDELLRSLRDLPTALPDIADNPWVNNAGLAVDRNGDPMVENVTVTGSKVRNQDGQLTALQTLLAGNAEEGLKKKVYSDSLGIPTVGIGHRILPQDDLKLGDEINDSRVTQLFARDGGKALKAAKEQAAKAGISDPSFLLRLAAVNFQLGSGWTSKFPDTWGKTASGDYMGAIKNLDESKWIKQTPARVQAFQNALLALPQKIPQ